MYIEELGEWWAGSKRADPCYPAGTPQCSHSHISAVTWHNVSRFHDKNESVKIDNEILQLLMKNKITFSNLDIDYDDPIKKILKVLGIKFFFNELFY